MNDGAGSQRVEIFYKQEAKVVQINCTLKVYILVGFDIAQSLEIS